MHNHRTFIIEHRIVICNIVYFSFLFRVSFKGSPKINFEAKPKVNDTKVPLMDVLTKALHNILIKEFEVCSMFIRLLLLYNYKILIYTDAPICVYFIFTENNRSAEYG